jgi:hypothetical protein
VAERRPGLATDDDASGDEAGDEAGSGGSAGETEARDGEA